MDVLLTFVPDVMVHPTAEGGFQHGGIRLLCQACDRFDRLRILLAMEGGNLSIHLVQLYTVSLLLLCQIGQAVESAAHVLIPTVVDILELNDLMAGFHNCPFHDVLCDSCVTMVHDRTHLCGV